MSTAHTIQTLFEIGLIALVIVCWVYEPLLARWERKQKRKVLKAFKEKRRYWK